MTLHYDVPKSWHDEWAKAEAERTKDPYYAWICSDEYAAVLRKHEIERLQENGEIVAGLA